MTVDTPAPRWLRWADTSAARAATTMLAIVAIISAILLGVRQQEYISCVANQQQADSVRTAAIAKATDVERIAQRKLIAATPSSNHEALRQAVLRAYDQTDAARAANPAPPPATC